LALLVFVGINLSIIVKKILKIKQCYHEYLLKFEKIFIFPFILWR